MGHEVPDMPGNKATNDLAQTLRYEVAALLGRKQTSFPGAQPVSFAARHIQELQRRDYYVCEKSDGIRCLMYMTQENTGEEVVYLIDRKNDYYHVPHLHFPLQTSMQEFHTNTIFDGELVLDTQANGEKVLKFLVFDCLVLDDQKLMHRTLDKRLAYFREKVYAPYRELFVKFPEEIQYLPFQVEVKKMELGYGIEMMFRDVLPNLPHGNDGLIFTCRTSPYTFGTDQYILKWKSEDENSVDFRMNLAFPMVDPDVDDPDQTPYPDYDEMPHIELSVYKGSDEYIPYGSMGIDVKRWDEFKALNQPLNDRIVECYLNKSKNWSYIRFREDKKEANHISTVESVMESIRDQISRDDLIKASRKIRDEWKRRQALEDEKARKEAETRKVGPDVQRHGVAQTPDIRSTSSGMKRKHEGDDDAL